MLARGHKYLAVVVSVVAPTKYSASQGLREWVDLHPPFLRDHIFYYCPYLSVKRKGIQLELE